MGGPFGLIASIIGHCLSVKFSSVNYHFYSLENLSLLPRRVLIMFTQRHIPWHYVNVSVLINFSQKTSVFT